jgi:predicted NACHT family NTPase
LTVTGVALITAAFAIHVDVPGLLINLGSSLLSTVVILIAIERRLRQSEISAILGAPRRFNSFVGNVLSPRRRRLRSFCLAQLTALEERLQLVVVPASFEDLRDQTGSLLVLGAPGTGKTTILQLLCAVRSRAYLVDSQQPLPIMLPLRYLVSGQTLEETILTQMGGYTEIKRAAFEATLTLQNTLMILDGADEIAPQHRQHFQAEFSRMKGKFPRSAWIVSSRDLCQFDLGLPVHRLPMPTMAEIKEINKRRRLKR